MRREARGWETRRMKKPTLLGITILVAGIAAAGAQAQTTSTPATSTKPAASATAAGSQTSTTTPKAGTTGTTKAPASKTGTATKPGAAPLTLKTEREKASYAIGQNIGNAMKRDAVDLDPAVLARGLRDALTGQKSLMTEEEMKTTLAAFAGEVRKKAMDKAAAEAAANKKSGDAYLAVNKTKPGVVTLPSGLQYRVITEGTGPKPKADDTVECQYKGTLLTGEEFDSSYKRGQSAKFEVDRVIKGWSEALQLMPVGSKWELVVPSDLAYGQRGAGGEIGPNSTLKFEVELVGIEPKAEKKEEAAPKADAAPKVEPAKPAGPPNR